MFLHSEIRMTPVKASWITVACCVLHNIAIDLNMPLDDEWGTDNTDFEDENETTECEPKPERADAQRDSVLRRLGNEKRQLIAYNTFRRH